MDNIKVSTKRTPLSTSSPHFVTANPVERHHRYRISHETKREDSLVPFFHSSPPFVRRIFNFPRCTRSRDVDWKNNVDLWGFGFVWIPRVVRSCERKIVVLFCERILRSAVAPIFGRVADRKGAQAMIFIARR